MATDDKAYHTHLTGILKLAKSSDYEAATKACNRLLHQFPNDALAFRIKIIGVIRQDKFKDALDFMSKNPQLSEGLEFEKAYCLYRLHRSQEAYDTLISIKEDSLIKKELLVQVLYRLGKYNECYELYKTISSKAEPDVEDEMQANLLAIQAGLAETNSLDGEKIVKPNPHVYEQLYNYGCLLANQGKFTEAKDCLQKAEAKCVEVLREDGLSEEEIAEETAVINAQIIYCELKLGLGQKEALKAYTLLMKNKPNNSEAVVVASSNILALNRDQNIFDSKKRIKALQPEESNFKLSQRQRYTMLVNMSLSLFLTSQYELSRGYVKELATEFPEERETANMIGAAIDVKTLGVNQAILNLKGVKPKNPIKIQLGMAQILLKEGKRQEAISALRDISWKEFRLGIVSALVTLYLEVSDYDGAFAVMQEAYKHYYSKNDRESLKILCRQRAGLLVAKGDLPGAITCLNELRKLDRNDVVTLAQLIITCSQHDTKLARELSTELPRVNVKSDLSLAELESPNWLATIKMARKADKETTSPVVSRAVAEKKSNPDTPLAEKKKRKKKKKLPPNADGRVDPERWLPKYERSGYRPKKVRKTRVEAVGKGTQGAASGASANYDMSQGPSSSKAEVTASPPTPLSSGRQQRKSKKPRTK